MDANPFTAINRAFGFLYDPSARGALQSDSLDGLRGLAVLYVVFSHLSNFNLVLSPNIRFAGIGSGQIGVYIFFTLSSFLLTRALLTRSPDQLMSRQTWGAYSKRRLLRIYPFYSTVLVFTVLATTLNLRVFEPMGVVDFLRHFLLLDGKLHLWTIAVEVKFYLVLPALVLVYVILLKRNLPFFLLVLATLAVLSSATAIVGEASRTSLLRHLPIFLAGSAAAAICEQITSLGSKKVQLFARKGSFVLFALLLMLMPFVFDSITHAVLGVELPWFHPHWEAAVAWGGLCSALVILVHLSTGGLLHRFLSSGLMRFFGAISFSLYINHWFVLLGVSRLDWPIFLKLLLFWTVAITISTLTFLIFERPFLRKPGISCQRSI